MELSKHPDSPNTVTTLLWLIISILLVLMMSCHKDNNNPSGGTKQGKQVKYMAYGGGLNTNVYYLVNGTTQNYYNTNNPNFDYTFDAQVGTQLHIDCNSEPAGRWNRVEIYIDGQLVKQFAGWDKVAIDATVN